ncbi:lactonase family protein [Nocardia panacis]|uniref:Lactonase family protein n=1 Tax=Nocardia panacis TaxID=2340916 RepID=A0A3A4KRH1_9NOCA|nr:lactonase family protein [Nocardia panacis]
MGSAVPPSARANTGTRACIGCYTSEGGRGIAVAAVDSASGRLVVTDFIDVADPSYLALAPDGRHLYAVDEGPAAGAATAVDLRPERPLVLNSVAVQGEGPTHLRVTPDGRRVLTANYGSGSVSVLSVEADGRLGAVTDVVRHEGSGPDPERQSAPHPHQIVIDPSGDWVLVVDLGVDSVYVYRLVEGRLRSHAQVRLVAGSGPRHLSFHPDGRRAYLANELNSTVTVCDWRAETGELRAGPAVAADVERGGDRNYPSEPVISPDGRFLYLANRGHDNIATFALLGDLLVPLGTAPCGGTFPRDLTLAPDGRRLYAANQKSNSVTWLDLDPLTGLPGAPSAPVEIPSATSIVFC